MSIVLIAYVIITILCLCRIAYALKYTYKKRVLLLELLTIIVLSFTPFINMVILIISIEPVITRFLDYLDNIVVKEKRN